MTRNSKTNNVDSTNPFDEILQEYFVELDKHQSVDQETFVSKHHTFEKELREFFEAEKELERFSGPKLQNNK